MKRLINDGDAPGSSSYYHYARGDIDGLLSAPLPDRGRPAAGARRRQTRGRALIATAVSLPMRLAGLVAMSLWLVS